MTQETKNAPAVQGEGDDTRKVNQMSTNIIPLNGQSPFDRIKQTREDGSEFWSARDLMPLMGYPRWADFQPVLGRAAKAAMNQGHDTEHHFRRSPKVIEGGRWGTQTVDDFELTRFSAYLVAMNGDPNKNEVAAAQSYFAVRTREAEVAKPVQELTFAEKTLEVMAGLQQMVADQKAENEKQARQLEEQKPVVARMKNYQANERSSNKQKFARDICKALREQLDIDALQADVHVFLTRKLNFFVAGKRSDAGEATAWAEKNFYAETRRKTAENGHNIAQGLITPRGYDYAWSRIFAYAETNGHIKLEGQISA